MRETVIPGRRTVVENNVPAPLKWTTGGAQRPRQTFRRVDEFKRSDVFGELGAIERLLELPQRPDTDFKTHADWENYLSGRADAAA